DKYDKNSRKLMLYQHDSNNPDSLFSNTVLVMLEDSRGIFWISVMGGLDLLDRKTGKLTHHPYKEIDPSMGPCAIAMLEDSVGDVWILNIGGILTRFDMEKMKPIKHYVHDPNDPNSIMVNTSNGDTIIEDRDNPGILWIVSSSGLEKFDKNTEIFTHYIHAPDDPASITPGAVWSVWDDGKGSLWASTFGGLSRFDKKTETFARYKHDPDNPDSIGFNKNSCVFEDSFGNFWVAGFENGMDKFDRKTGKFRHFNKKNGFPAVGINHTIQEDNDGNLWIGASDIGLIKFNIETESVVTVYTKSDGLQDNAFWRSYKTKDGKMWFGGGGGLNSFYPEDITDNPYVPPVMLTSFRQGGEDADLGMAPEKLKEVTLDWTANFFEFQFAALNYTRPEKNQYAYMLEGADEDWYYSGTNPFGRYSNIPGGSYILKLKGSNNDGIWNEEGASIRITVMPPPWKRPWAYALYLMATASLVFAFLRHHKNKLEQQQTIAAQERRAAERLRQLDKVKDEFLANTSHELRTPLNGIVGIADSLMDGYLGQLTEEQRYNLSLIATSGRRLNNLINDILDFSKLKHHELLLRTKPLDMRSVTDVVLALSRTSAGNKEIELVNEIEPDIPATQADEDRVQQILYNLVGNAVKFTDTGIVSVSAQVQGEYLAVTVSDTGIGIPEEKLDRIFESFEQADGSTSREYGGTGLGLAVTKNLVKLHGGQIRVESVPKKGSHFTFTLPISKGKAESLQAADILERDTPVAGISIQTKEIGYRETAEESAVTDVSPEDLCRGSLCRILVVDDEPVNLQVLKNQLTSAHYSVTLASGGREALDTVENAEEFDLVLLDVMMPGMSGYEVCRHLRNSYKPDELPVVMLTAKNRVEDLMAGFDAGGNDYLTKPFMKNELIARVKSHINMKDLAAQVRDLVNNLEQKVAERTVQLQESLENLKKTQEHLVQSEKMASLGGLVAGVAHEINTPVGIGVTEASFLDEKTREFSELYNSGSLKRSDFEKYIKNATGSANSILSNLERAAELIAGFKQVAVDQSIDEKRKFALKSYICEILFSLDPKYKKASHTTIVNCPEDLEIASYPGAFSRIIANFVTNSLIHGFDGIEKREIRFDVTTEKDELLFCYSDNGRGMDEKTARQIFDPFFTTNRSRGGTGLGMHIVYNLVTQTLGGQIKCNSAPGKGTSFLIKMKFCDLNSEIMKYETGNER
ncbi:ATP-binding protein, partial [Desulfobacterales bacterium HSG16]|nr:ATP-binding protein [Desulfobacterales bacterium HSG16]